MGKISTLELASVLSKRYGLNKKAASAFVTSVFDVVQQALEKESVVKVKGLGTFKIIDVDARESVNVNTGERVLIEGHNKITFTPDSLMKELVNKPFSQFETVVLNEGVDFAEADVEPAADSAPEEPVVAAAKEEPAAAAKEEPAVVAKEEPAAMPLVDFGEETEEDIPEWVIEPVAPQDPAAMPPAEEVSAEEVPAEEIQAETSGPAQDEPAVDEPAEDEPVEDKPAEDEPAEDEPAEAEEEEEEPERSGNGKWLIALLTFLIGLGAGYFLGNCFPFPFSDEPLPEKQEAVKQPVKKAVRVEKPGAVQKKDSIQATPRKDSIHAVPTDTEKPVAEKPAAEKAAAEKPAATESPVAWDKYQQKDARVRTGAWRIVGTAHVVKVKAGETLAKISRHYLGPDMECYVEVYNDLTASTPLKAGQEIKIPKLEHKKNKKAPTNK